MATYQNLKWLLLIRENKRPWKEVATTPTEDGHKYVEIVEYQNKLYNIGQKTKEHKTTEEEMEGPTSTWGSRNRKHA